MTLLRLISFLSWGTLLAYMLPAAWAAASSRKTRWGDPVRFGMANIAAIFMSFSLRILFFPHNDWTLIFLQLWSIAAAIYHIVLARIYGRGRLL